MGENLEHIACNLCGGLARGERLLFEKMGYRVVQCRHCDLVYVNPRIVRAELWERYGQDYFENTYIPAMGDFDPATNFTRFEPILQKLHSLQPGRGSLLDIGCATGLFLEATRRDGWRVIGTEISQYAAQYARDKFGLEVLVTTMEEQSVLPSGHFDAVTMWETIEHLENPFETLCSANKVMKSGGILALSTPNFASLTYSLVGREWWVIGPSDHLYYFTPETLTQMLRKAGFKAIEVFTLNLDLNYVAKGLMTKLPALFQRTSRCTEGNFTELNHRTHNSKRITLWMKGQAWLANVLGPKVINCAMRYHKGDTLIAYARKCGDPFDK